MTTIHPTTAKRRKARIADQLGRRTSKIMRRLPDCEWVLAYRYLGQSKRSAQHEWHCVASSTHLSTAVMDQQAVLEKALAHPPHPQDVCPVKPRNSVVRAAQVRQMLREAWRAHVKGTPHAGSAQMYRLVQAGEVQPFPWWHHIVGRHVRFTNTAVNVPEVSSALWDFLIAQSRRAE